MNRGIYGLSTQAVNGLGVLTAPGQSLGVYARVIPWLSGFPNSEGSQSITFTPRPYVVIGTDPTIVSNNGNSQFTGLALQLPNVNSAFITIPALTDTNYATQNFGVSVGGARGQAAVDVQTYRSASTQVASGLFATAVGQVNTASGTQALAVGYGNTTSGSQSTAIGYSNTSSSVSTVALGYLNTASSTNAVAIGQSNNVSNASLGVGISNTVAGSNATAVGYSNSASGSQSLAIGFGNTASLIFNSAIGVYAGSTFAYSLSLSANRFAANGDSQLIFARQSYQTTTATATQLFGDNTTGAVRLTVAASTSYAYKLQLVARQTGGTAGTAGDTAVWNIEGGVYRAAAGNAILLGAVQTSYVAVTAAAAWTATVSADTVNQALVVTVAGEANKNINWVAFWQLVRSA